MAETEQNGGGNGNGSAQTVMSTLKSKELLVPAALSAAGAIVAAKAPDLIHKLGETAEKKGEGEAEELGEKAAEGAKKSISGGKSGLAGKALSKALPGGGDGGGGGGAKKTRRLPIQRWTDVAVPVEKAYEAWNDFDQYPKFMHRVLNVRQKGDDKVEWHEKVWFSSRQWEGRITERRKNDRIAWKTTSGMSHRGVVTFHRLSDNLTRVMVDMEFEPNGMIEKMASGLRFVKRAVQADLARFKAYVEMEDAKGIEYRSGKDEDENREDSRRDREQARKERRESAKAS
jgi:ribosome-associated toxin RatA of RatAB toxin-antitoxin module